MVKASANAHLIGRRDSGFRTCENPNEIISRQVLCRLFGILEEYLRRIMNLERMLTIRPSAVDA